jgi:glycosyltransferase involved in cell wall biosynthesis
MTASTAAGSAGTTAARLVRPVLLCLSHLRWDFVFQRPQHLMTRAAAAGGYQVVFFEEPLLAAPGDGGGAAGRLDLRRTPEGVLVATPRLPPGLDAAAADAAQRDLLDKLLAELAAPVAVAWFYTPMALAFAGHVRATGATVYDCMDELSLFRGASPGLALLERRLLKRADLVFTGGRSLYRAKRRLHPRVHLFPSSVDAAHFRRALAWSAPEPADQAGLARPRVGFFGVIDERVDYALLDAVAERRPHWQLVMLGPTAKIDPASLPRRPNLHWLGPKRYSELPAYLAGWDAGLMPFALNEATRFISPTKTPEFLAAGVPLVSTPVPDVVADWGGQDGLVEIAHGPEAVIAALETALARPSRPWLARVDQGLRWLSWDATWARMQRLIEDAASGGGGRQRLVAPAGEPTHV